MCFSHGQVSKQYNRGGKLFNKRSGKTCFHLAKKCKGPYIVGTRDTEELKIGNMKKLLNKIHSCIGEDAINKDNKIFVKYLQHSF